MKTEYKVIVLSILLGLFLWVVGAALDYFIYYQGTFWGLLIYEIPPHEIYVRTLVLGCCLIFGVAISTVFGKFRRAEEKRRESEKQLRLAVKNSRDVLYKLNLRTGDFDYASPSVVELGGYTPQEFILLSVKGVLRRIHPEDRHRFMMHFRNVLRQAVEDGLAPTIEYRWKHNNGEYRWFSDNRTVIRDGDGNPVSLIGSVRDVTEQKEAEWALWESEKKYRTMIETAQEGIGITSPGEELVFVNKAFASILGYEPSELVGRNLREFVTEERFEAFQMETGKRQWGTSGRYETEMRHQDGSHRSLLVSASPLYDREGNYNGTLGMVTDITERKKAEEALRASEERYRDLFENASDLIQSVAPDGRFIYVNRAWREALGYSKEEIAGLNIFDIIHPDSRARCVKVFRRVMSGEEIDKVEAVFVAKDGTEIMVEGTANCKFVDGKPISTRGIFRDITERRKAEEALRKAHDELEIRVQERTAELVRANEDLLAEIAERNRVEDALRLQSEIVANMAEGVQLTRASDGVIVYTNPRFEDMFGYGHGELIGKNVSVLNAPSDKSPEDAAAEIIKSLSEEGVWYGEIQNIKKDGTHFWCRASVSTLEHRQHGEVWVAIHEDITTRKRAEQELDKHRHHLEELVGERTADLTRTNERLEQQIAERKQAEEALKESEEKFRAVVENAPNVIFNVDREGTIQFINRTRPDTGVEEVIGKKIYHYILPEYHTVVRETIDGVFESGKPGRYEIRGSGLEGGILWYDTQVGAIKQNGKVVAVTLITTDITERKRAEEALWKSEEKYRLVSENIPVAVYSALPDEHSTTTLISGRILELTGYSHQEFVEHAQLWAQIIHPDDREYVWKKIEEHREKMAPLDVEYRITTKDNTVKWIRDRATPMVDENGQLIRINGFMEDIAERKRAEEALRASRDYLEKLTNSMWDAVLSVRMPERVIEWANDSFRLIGYEPEECIGRTTEFLYPDKSEYLDFGNKLKSVIAAGKNILRAEQSLKRKNGELFPAEIVTTIFREKGEVVRVTSIVRDITERKQAEEALRETRDYLDNLIEYANAPIIVWNAEFTITRFNRAFEHLTGYSAEEVVGQHLRTLFPEDSREKSLRNIERTSSGEYWESVEIPILRRDGEIRVALWNSANIYAEDGKTLLATIAQGHDITERKRAEEALKESEEKFRAVVENAPNVILNVDREGTIQFINQTPPDRTVEEVIGTKIYDYILPEYHTVVRETIDRVFQSGEPGRYEIRGLGLEGEILWYDTQVGAIKQDGKVVAVTLIATDITERKKAEEALQESEAKWRSITENSPDHIMLLDREANIQFFNQTVPDLTKEQVIGTPIYNYVPEDYRPVMKESFERVMNTGQPDQYEVEYKSADGSTQVYETSVGPVLRGDEVVALTLSSRDITERKKAEEALRESEEKYRSFVRNFHGIAFRGDMEFLPQFFHGAVEEITGYTENEFIAGKPSWEKVIHPEDIPKIHESAVKLSSIPDYSADREYRIIRKDGQIRWVHELIQNICDDSGKPTLVQGALYDITERKKAEEAIRRSEEQLRALFDSAADTVFTKDLEGHYTRVNAACAKLHGLCEKEFIGKTDFDLFPEEHAQHFRDLDRHVIKEGRTFTGEYERPIGGKLHTFSVVKTPLYGPQGSIIGLCGIARDVTEQRSLEEQFRQAQKMESLGTLAGGVAHDFNNLLGGILGYVGLMKGDYSPGEKHYAMLELVEKAGVRAAELTNQLLAFSRKGKYEVRPVSLNNSVEDVLKLMGRTLDKSIEIATELQEKLPSVEGDPGQLEQAIINLCVNAAEAMPGGGKLQLETRVVALGEEFARKYLGSDPGDYVLLSVSDTGIGMDSETLSRMFEPFFTTKEMGKGTGLGLSTVYGIVKNHGGYVDVRSQPGKGSTFDIYLPVSKKQFTPPRPRAAELQTGHETILAVDDEEIIRSLLEETLKKLGYKVILANDGEEAVQIYEERKDEIDAVIIDMIMPHLGGGETFREIKMRNPDVRVLLVSGFSQDGAAQRILDEGVRGFIQKPFELVELSQKLRQILD